MTHRGEILAVTILLFLEFPSFSFGAEAKKVDPKVPSITELMKPNAYKKMIEDRDVISYATLDRIDPDTKADPPLKKYRFYAGVLIHASLQRTRAILTDYKIYSKIVPYIDKTEFKSETALLDLQGSFLSFQLKSIVHFIERTREWIQYKIVGGHFTGLVGNMYFETLGEKGTAVYFDGEHSGWHWPPAFIVEKGAEIVFGFTARRMRSYVESSTYVENEKDEKKPAQKEAKKAGSKDDQKTQSHLEKKIEEDSEVPRPKRRFEIH